MNLIIFAHLTKSSIQLVLSYHGEIAINSVQFLTVTKLQTIGTCIFFVVLLILNHVTFLHVIFRDNVEWNEEQEESAKKTVENNSSTRLGPDEQCKRHHFYIKKLCSRFP